MQNRRRYGGDNDVVEDNRRQWRLFNLFDDFCSRQDFREVVQSRLLDERFPSSSRRSILLLTFRGGSQLAPQQVLIPPWLFGWSRFRSSSTSASGSSGGDRAVFFSHFFWLWFCLGVSSSTEASSSVARSSESSTVDSDSFGSSCV